MKKEIEINGLKRMEFNNDIYTVTLEFYNRFDYADFMRNLKDNDWRDDRDLFLQKEEENEENDHE